ncbi:PIN domain-containing protein [Desulfobacterales bacterium HSG2]|nr:PIN domain-containing protein [Desulfobacterales bacterium HSG2]
MSSAWLTLIEDEDGADIVQELLEKSKTGDAVILVSFMSFMEVYYITLQERDVNEAQARVNLMSVLPVSRTESDTHLAILASELKAAHHLSVADAWIAALAKAENAVLVHKDPEFEQIEAVIKVMKLP